MKSNKEEEDKVSILEWFQRIFTTIFDNEESLMKDFSKAREDYPSLCFVLQAYSVYFRYLAQWQKSHSHTKTYSISGGITDIPFPPEPPSFPPWRPDITTWLEDLQRISQAELNGYSERIADSLHDQIVQIGSIRTCEEIVRDFEAAAACIERYTENLPQNDEEWEEFHECLDNLQEYASEIEANGCSLS